MQRKSDHLRRLAAKTRAVDRATEDRDVAMAYAIREGLSLREVAAAVNLSPEGVRKILIRRGIKP
jgi:hypothetical protein